MWIKDVWMQRHEICEKKTKTRTRSGLPGISARKLTPRLWTVHRAVHHYNERTKRNNSLDHSFRASDPASITYAAVIALESVTYSRNECYSLRLLVNYRTQVYTTGLSCVRLISVLRPSWGCSNTSEIRNNWPNVISVIRWSRNAFRRVRDA